MVEFGDNDDPACDARFGDFGGVVLVERDLKTANHRVD